MFFKSMYFYMWEEKRKEELNCFEWINTILGELFRSNL